MTQFFLLFTAISKRVPQSIPRIRTRPIPLQPVEADPIIHAPHRPEPDAPTHARLRPRYPLPRRTPPQPVAASAGTAAATTTTGAAAAAHDAHAPREEQEEEEEEHVTNAPGLDGCKFVNREEEVWPVEPSPTKKQRKCGEEGEEGGLLERGLAQWDDEHSVRLAQDEELYGDALQLRTGRYRERLKRDIYRRDGASCAASALGPTEPDGLPDEPLFCTQIIPESFDTDRFMRFRKMASVVFSGQYDDLLEPLPAASATPSSKMMDMDVDHSNAPPQPPRRARAATHGQGHYPRPENILRTTRNAINLSEKWLRWFDEGRFVIREWGGQFYIRCLDPSLYHDPSFSRQGMHPNDPWERGHGLRLDIGATPPGVGVNPSTSVTFVPPASVSQQQQQQPQQPQQQPSGTMPSYHQLPTPVPTPTSPAPVSPFHEPQRIVFGLSPIAGAPMHLPPIATAVRPAMAGTAGGARHLPRYHHRQNNSLPSFTSTAPSRRPHQHAPAPPMMQLHSHEGQPSTHVHARHAGPFAAGQASRRAYQHSRGASVESTASPVAATTAPSRHSIKALLNPTASASASKLPPSVISSTNKPADVKPVTHAAQPVRLMPVRRELWDVDALDPRLVKLHEQIVSMWWDTGLPTEIGVQTRWVDSLPLPEMNVLMLGEQMFAAVLQHKLKLL